MCYKALAFSLTHPLTVGDNVSTPQKLFVPSPELSTQIWDIPLCQNKTKPFSLCFFFWFMSRILFSKPKVISLLQQGDDPCKVERVLEAPC